MNEPQPIPITAVKVGEEEKHRVLRVLDSGWLAQGQEVAAFEKRLARYTHATHAVATTSGTAALHVAVKALGLGPGDEVIVPAFTWVATPNVVVHCGATTVFCDVNLDTFNLDPGELESLITPRTVGILPVHLFGLGADMATVHDLARRHGLWVVEDAACALGTTIQGHPVGRGSNAACFSFHPRKSITTGEGGMIVTRDSGLANQARALRNHGAAVRDLAGHPSAADRTGVLLPDFDVFGFNYRMTDLQAAVGHGQFDHLDDWIARRRALATLYREQLASIDWIQCPADDPGHSYQSFACLFRPEPPSLDNLDRLEAQRDQLLIDLDAHGIVTRQGTHAPVRLACYRNHFNTCAEATPRAWMAQGLSFALPLFPSMTESQVQRVIGALIRCAPDA